MNFIRSSKDEYSNIQVGLTKFFTLRPKQCTHMVCVCTYHQNVKLMLNGGDIANLTAGTAMPLTSYKDCLRKMMCLNPTPTCHLMTTKTPSNECCKSCPGLSAIRENLNNQVTDVQFEKWVGTDRFTISTQLLSSDDFVDSLCDALDTLKPHAYIAEEQALYFKTLKETIVEGEILVQCNFAENYSFVVQDAVQSFHWNNEQATLLTSVFYYRDGNEIKHGIIVMISDDLKHDTATVYAFQKILYEHLLGKAINVSKIIYGTDGASQHFKNRFNFVNLFYYNEDFNADAEIHFHATSHGKGPCDGLGGNLKRLATRASLQLPASNAIVTPMRLYEWAKSSLKQTAIYYCSKDNIQRHRIFLHPRFDSAITIPGTKKLHAFIPTTEGLLVKRTSSSVDYKIRTEEVRSTVSSEILSFSTAMSLRADGNVSGAKLIQELDKSPGRAKKIWDRYSKKQEPFKVSPQDALVRYLNYDLTRSSYIQLRKDHINYIRYPGWDTLTIEKKLCYPDGITINEEEATVKLQSMARHTTARLAASLPASFPSIATVLFKWGFDSSSMHNLYRHLATSTGNLKHISQILATNIVPIQIKSDDQEIIQTTAKRKMETNVSDPSVKPATKKVRQGPNPVGKRGPAFAALASSLPKVLVTVGETLGEKLPMSVFEEIKGCVLNQILELTEEGVIPKFKDTVHNMGSIYLNTEVWRKDTKRYPEVAERIHIQKKKIQEKIHKELGIIVDVPKQTAGTTNYGNTARRFFANPKKTAAITGIDEELIHRFHIILVLINSSNCEFDVDAFARYTEETAKLYVKKYNWYKMPASVHKVLIHGSLIWASSTVPLDLLSEDAQGYSILQAVFRKKNGGQGQPQ
ncbi:unnamed protein product [Brassicogethes aeneus]|uniref:Uncharacterized protein n=1 Tax=Brassicogethes aeneus TaxID=1431903 RepID=A0A9P0AYC3_BRAAE|nr:unnamed protein product [Brassicogethes aeneus]